MLGEEGSLTPSPLQVLKRYPCSGVAEIAFSTMFESTRSGDGSTGSTIDFQSIRWLCDGGSRLSGPTRSACELLRKLGDNGGMSRILSQIDGLVRIRLVVVQFNHFGGVEKLLIAVGVVALGILIGGLGSPPFGIAVSTRPDGITDSIARCFQWSRCHPLSYFSRCVFGIG